MKEDGSQSRLAPIDRDRRLIEEIIPLKEISEQSAKEKNIRHGHISTMHVWWARRPLVACRAAIFASLIPYSRDPKERDQIIDFIKKISSWKASDDLSLLKNAKKIILRNKDSKYRVLDPFSGGGAIPLEAMRLGCETYALDLNPVAHIIELASLDFPQRFGKQQFDSSGFSKGNKLLKDYKKWADWVLNFAKEKSSEFFSCGDGTVIAYLWARNIKCQNPSCGAEIPLVRQFLIRKKKNSNVAIKPHLEEKRVKFQIKFDKEIDFEAEVGTMKRDTVTCLYCGNSINGKEIRKLGKAKKIGEQLIAKVVMRNGKKTYEEITDEDIELYNRAKYKLNQLLKQISFKLPEEKIIEWSGVFNAPLYGIERWIDIFNSRQLLTTLYFIEGINAAKKLIASEESEEYSKVIATYLAITFNKLVGQNNSLARWTNSRETIAGMYSRQALAMVWDYAEVNPFSGYTGDWNGAVNWISRVIEHCSKIDENPAKVIQGSANRLPFQDKYFDAIITDPPYYDSVPYSDLSDFFYIWMKLLIGEFYRNIFATPLTPKSNEIVQHSLRHPTKEKAKEFYEREMTNAFKEINRTLKDNGITVILFAHKSTEAWETLVNSLINANLLVTASWPLNTEMGSRLRAKNSAALASSIFIVCRKRKSEEEGYFSEVKEELKKKIKAKLDQFWSQGIRGADFFISAIGPAVEVFGKYKRVMKLSGEEVSVAELLDLVREIVTDYSLEKILHGRHMGKVDEQTRFYLLWRWAYDDNDVPYDDARKLAQALGTEADELLNKKDMLEKKGDKVNLMEPWQRKKNAHLGEPKGGIPAPMIDVIHKACLLWEKGNKQELSEFIENSGYADDDTIWNVAQAISEVLPDGNKEKQLIQGLLASKHSISKDVSSKQGKLGEYFK